MNPILQAALGSIVRFFLAALFGYVVKAGIWSASEAETYVGAGTLAVLGLGWSLWAKYRDRIKLLTALSMPHGVTENDVKEHIANGGATPSVSTPKDEVPHIRQPRAVEDIYPPDAA